jgi:hypothetical protein
LYKPVGEHCGQPGNTGAYRELDDTDAICPGYGELTAVEAPKNQNAEVDLMFVREDRLTGG